MKTSTVVRMQMFGYKIEVDEKNEYGKGKCMQVTHKRIGSQLFYVDRKGLEHTWTCPDCIYCNAY